MPSPSNRLHRNQNKFLIDLIGKDLKDFSPAETALLVIFTVLVMAIIHFVVNRLLKFLSGVREHDTDGSFKSGKDLKNGKNSPTKRNKSTKKKKKIYYELPLPLLSASKIQEKLDENIKNKIQPTWRVENIKETQSHLALHDKNKTVEWVPKSKKFAWCPVESNLLLMLPAPQQQYQEQQEAEEENEERIVEFDIGDLQRGQIGVGFMLVFDESQHDEHEINDINDDDDKGKDDRQSTKNSNSSHFGIPVSVDWGFFGYLGSSKHAWSYDPSTGDVVTATESIEGGLPKLSNGGGKVRLIFNSSASADDDEEQEGDCYYYAQFEIDGKRSKKIPLPQSEDEEGSVVVMIAACLLKQGQRVTLNLIK